MPDLLDRLRPALADRYRIESELGRGGMATVYLAEDLRHGRRVAVKVLHPQFAGGYEPERFLREIRTAARLSHPQILPLHDSGTFEWGPGVPGLYFVMPYVGCESVRERLRRERQLPIDEALRIARAVAAALDYAHRHDVLHRDIKPENILLHEGQAVVADFGIARALSAAGGEGSEIVTAGGMAVGTPAYMSPEQASADRQLDARSDIYSLACVLFEMLVGEPPFAGSGARATMARHALEPAASVRSRRPEVPAAVDDAIARALAKDPEHRFPGAAEFADALKAASLDSGPVATLGQRPQGVRAIAVLPFVNTSSDPENEYFSDGMTDELINALTQVEGLRVASRTSVFALKGTRQDIRAIGALLNMSTVLEGTVRKVGRRLRITAQLTCTHDGRHLWAGRYDREVEDVFAIQEEIARTIVDTLRANLVGDLGDPTPKRYTENVTAYNLYLKGRYCWNMRTPEGIAEGIRYFEQAIEADAGYALAYTGLADSHALHVDYRGAPVADGMRRAKAMAERALELDDTLAEAHNSLAWVLFIYDWEWETAERHFRRAIELNPRYATARQWYAWLLIALARYDEALAEGRAAVELDPGSVSIRRSMGWLYYYARQPTLAIEHLRLAVTMNPTADESHYVLGLCYAGNGMLIEAEASLREAAAGGQLDARVLAALGHVAALRGRPDETRRALAEVSARAEEQYVSPVDFVVLHLALDDIDAAFEWLERAYAERRGWLAYLKVEPLLDRVRGDTRFDLLRQRMRLV